MKKQKTLLEAEEERRRAIIESGFAYYLFQYYKSWQGYSAVYQPEVKSIENYGHYALQFTFSSLITLVIIVDRERSEEAKPRLTTDLLLPALDRATDARRKNDPKARLIVEIIEVDRQPPTAEDRRRIASLKGTRFSPKKPYVFAAYVDVSRGTVISNTLLPTHRWRLEQLLRGANSGQPLLLASEEEFGVLPRSSPWLTYASSAVLVVVFFWEVAISESWGRLFVHSSMDYHERLALYSGVSDYSGLAQQLGTHAFLHSGLEHLLLNGFLLLVAGSLVERLLGRSWYLLSLAAGAIGGGLLFVVIESQPVLLRGASGALMGVIAIGLVSLLRVPQGPMMRYYGSSLIGVFVCSLIPLEEHVSYSAHLGGALGAALFAPLLLGHWPRNTIKPERSWLVEWLGFAAAIWLLYAGALIVLELSALT